MIMESSLIFSQFHLTNIKQKKKERVYKNYFFFPWYVSLTSRNNQVKSDCKFDTNMNKD